MKKNLTELVSCVSKPYYKKKGVGLFIIFLFFDIVLHKSPQSCLRNQQKSPFLWPPLFSLWGHTIYGSPSFKWFRKEIWKEVWRMLLSRNLKEKYSSKKWMWGVELTKKNSFKIHCSIRCINGDSVKTFNHWVPKVGSKILCDWTVMKS